MPFIELKTNQTIENTVKENIKKELGLAITAIPGKSENWLMVEISDGLDMWFKGDNAPTAMLEVAIFGKASNKAYESLTKRLCKISEELIGVSPDRTYIKYSEIDRWGYNNFNF